MKPLHILECDLRWDVEKYLVWVEVRTRILASLVEISLFVNVETVFLIFFQAKNVARDHNWARRCGLLELEATSDVSFSNIARN